MAAGITFNPASFRGSEINRTLAKRVAPETTGSGDGYQPSAPAAVYGQAQAPTYGGH